MTLAASTNGLPDPKADQLSVHPLVDGIDRGSVHRDSRDSIVDGPAKMLGYQFWAPLRLQHRPREAVRHLGKWAQLVQLAEDRR